MLVYRMCFVRHGGQHFTRPSVCGTETRATTERRMTDSVLARLITSKTTMFTSSQCLWQVRLLAVNRFEITSNRRSFSIFTQSPPSEKMQNLIKIKQGTLSKSLKSKYRDCTYIFHIHRMHQKHLSLYLQTCPRYANYNIL